MSTKQTVTTTTRRKTTRNRRRRQGQRQRRKNNRGKGNNPKPALSPYTSVHISECAKDYLIALSNPFGVKTQPCIPDNTLLPSFKFSSKASGTFATGSGGVGYVLLDPFKMAVSGITGAVAENYPVLYTLPTNGFADFGDPYSVSVSLSTDLKGANCNSPFNISYFSGDHTRQYRLVGCGLKIQYVGSNFRNQGRVFLFKEQSNVNIPVGFNGSDMSLDNYTRVLPIKRKSEYIFYMPSSSTETSYQSIDTWFSHQGGLNHYGLVIYVDGGDLASPQSWTWEVVAHFEAIGPNMPGLTRSQGDAAGLTGVLGSAPTRAPQGTPEAETSAWYNRVMSGLAGTATYVMQNYGATIMQRGTDYAAMRLGLNTAYPSMIEL